MPDFIEYAPIILVVIWFLLSYKVFITPVQLKQELQEFEKSLEKKYVHKEAHEIIISEMKEDINEIKTKIDVIYNKIMGL